MDIVVLIARVVLALVFFAAGAAKLADRAGSRRALIDFGVPASLASPLGRLLPPVELAVAVVLIPAATAWWGALGAMALLLVFVAGIGLNLARGRKPECRCFGQLHSAPAGWKTLARNGTLLAGAGFVVWQGRDGAGPGVLSWVGHLSVAQMAALVSELVVLGLLGGQWWFLMHVLRQNGRLLVRVEALEGRLGAGGAGVQSPSGVAAQAPEGLPVGTEAPEFTLKGLHGETLTLRSLRAPAKPVMLVFTDPGCGPCNALLPEVGRWQEEHREKLTVSLVSRGDAEENRAKASEHGLTGVLLQEDWEVGVAYRVGGTPSAVLLSPEGKVASPVMGGAEGIRALLAHAVGEQHAQLPMIPPQAQGASQGQPCPNCGKAHPNGGHAHQALQTAAKVGDPAPEIRLANLQGETVELEDFRGEETLVLFWNPGCGFCQQMLPDLKEWEENRPEDAPRLLVVSAGTEEANREMGLTSTVVLDQHFAAGQAFGASGTPSAVLVDAEGKVASDLAVGTSAVLQLAGASRTGG